MQNTQSGTFEKVLVALVIFAIVIVGAFMIFRPTSKSTGGAFGPYVPVTVSTGVSVTTTSTPLLAAASSRQYAYIANAGSNAAYINVSGGVATTGSGIYIPAGGNYHIDSLNDIASAITAVTATGTDVFTVTASQ